MHRLWIALGALAGFAHVALSAYAAHGAAPSRALDNALGQHGIHALALIATGLVAQRRPGLLANLAGGAFALGLLLFCGTLYAAALADIRLGSLAPFGGLALMLGWLCLALAAMRRA